MNKTKISLSEILLFFYVLSTIIFFGDERSTFIPKILAFLTIVSFFFNEILLKRNILKFPFPLVVFFILLLFSFINSDYNTQTITSLISFTLVFIMSFTIVNMLMRTGDYRAIEFAVYFGILYNFLLVYSKNGVLLNIFQYARLGGTFGNANVFGFVFVVSTIFALIRLMNFSKDDDKILIKYFVFAGIIFLNIWGIIFYSKSKTAIIVFVIIMAVWSLIRLAFSKKYNKIIYLIIILVIGLVTFNLISSAIIQTNRFNIISSNLYFNSSGGIASDVMRLRMIDDGVSLWLKRPVIGWGFDQFRYISFYGTYSHNNYIELLCNLGIVGFVLFYSIYFYLIYYNKRILNMGSIKVPIISGFFILVLLLYDITIVSFTYKLPWIILSMIIGLTINSFYSVKKEKVLKKLTS